MVSKNSKETEKLLIFKARNERKINEATSVLVPLTITL